MVRGPQEQAQEELTITELLRFLAPKVWRRRRLPSWPPDAFALAMALLQRSGAYARVLEDGWPPIDGPLASDGSSAWCRSMRQVGGAWRQASVTAQAKPPPEARSWWQELVSESRRPVAWLSSETATAGSVSRALLSIVAAADEACEGAGLRAPPRLGSGHQTREDDHFVLRTVKMLHEKTGAGAASLCSDDIHPSRLVVLPKLHTPQFGLTARSFSHHLALCPGGAVRSLWYNVQRLRDSRRRPGMNLLVLPWPDRVVPADFQARRAPDAERDFGLFSYSPDGSGEGPAARLVDLLEVAEREVGLIDGVVLPELSVTEAEYQALLGVVHEKGAFLVAGVRGEEGSSWEEEVGANSCTLSFPITPHEGLMISQGKHHRWRLDRRQIRQYGIGSRLDPTSFWWEDTRIVTRKLHFVGLDWWVTASVLICEDLARLEPVSEVVRAVGPNLVIALLMDGPQLESRWPARYATVLADDPGCSVLTVTSLGMAQLSRSESGDCGSRTVALWKDDKDGRNIPIELPVGSEGVVLCLARETKAEWTADHRIGPDRAYYPTLVGVHPVRCGNRMSYTAVDQDEA